MNRSLLNVWGWMGIAPGYRYIAVEQFGQNLAKNYALTCRLPNGCTLECNLKEFIERQIYFMGTYEPIESYVFSQLLAPEMVVVDIGANIGQYTLLAATAIGEQGSVHSFEPVPKLFERMKSNVRRNQLSNVRLNSVGIWQETTAMQLGLLSDSENHCELYSVGFSSGINQVTATAIALDDYVREQNLHQIDLIKMDIEGAEYSALLGMKNTLLSFYPTLLLEINRPALKNVGRTPEEIWQLMVEELKYDVYRIGLGGCQKVTHFPNQEQSTNYLFVHPSRPTSPIIQEQWQFKQLLRWSRRYRTVL
ncbi:FkbM family methyltransferase [Cyanobacteria bacterium FACHB-63]|nr:FkbM family methyltransferase [Cyanobacteria bacterium FACHB-63]